MPVYIRKNLSFTPPSIYNMQLEDDSDYLLDPDQMRDVLPQPYRMINKILTQLLDSVWEIVETKENSLLAEARKVRPPRFDEPEELPIFNNATALGASSDGKFVFVGLPNGLAVMDALTQTSISTWEEDKVEINSIKSHLIGPDFHLVVTSDDMATSRLFLFAFNHLFFIKTMNENTPEAAAKILCQKCEASKDGEYAGIVLENTGSKEIWLEVHKLPVEGWLKELESIGAAVLKQREEEEKENEATEPQEGEPPAEQVKQESPRPIYVDNATVERLGVKFSQPTVILKIKPPPDLPLPGNPSSSVASAVQKVDTGDVLGTGLNHILSTADLESRDAMFDHRHEAMIKYLPKEKEEQLVSATFHFVNASRMITFGLEQAPADDKTVSLALWWAGSPHLCQYSLLKTGKDLEMKPDIVWPFTTNITCSATSSCTCYLAVGLENGNVVLWDRQMGLHKAVLNASSKSAVKSIHFLEPCLFPLEMHHYPPYPVTSATFLLVECANGTQMLFDTCDGSQQIPRCIAGEPENDDDIETLLQVIPELPELMVYSQKNGNMYIKDIGTGTALCQIALPPTHQLQSPWDPVIALGGGGQILYVKGEGTEVGEEGESTDISSVFMYYLRSYPVLDNYWARGRKGRELPVYTTHEERVTALMQERMQQQALRKPRMQRRWGQLRSELDIVQQARRVRVNSLQISTPTSINSIPEEIKFRQSTVAVI